jgi:hypothetical protein
LNCYIPTDDGTTSEIDVIMVHRSGVYVFESKNYDGWIFGSEPDWKWTQAFPNGQRIEFLNPLRQNAGHIKWLRHLLPEAGDIFRSIIVFGDRCQLKKIELTTDAHQVVKLDQLLAAVQQTIWQYILLDESVEAIWRELWPRTQVDQATRESHIAAVHRRDRPATAVGQPGMTAVTPDWAVQPNQGAAALVGMTTFSPREAVPHPGAPVFLPGPPIVFPGTDALHPESAVASSGATAFPTWAPTISSETATPPPGAALVQAGSAVTAKLSPKADATGLVSPVCRCGATMVLREAAKGEHKGRRFWGCPRYPKCHHIVNLD